MPTFNEFLASGEGDLNRDQADFLLDELTHYGVIVRWSGHLIDFMDEHPELSRTLTEEDFADGLQSWHTMWERYLEWRRVAQAIPLRRLGGDNGARVFRS